jgi:hypothetical protein
LKPLTVTAAWGNQTDKRSLGHFEMFDFYLSLEQDKRKEQALDAVYEDTYADCAPRTAKGNRNRGLAAEGRWDALMGVDPKMPQEQWYWDSYCDALRSVWLKKLGIEIEHEF